MTVHLQMCFISCAEHNEPTHRRQELTLLLQICFVRKFSSLFGICARLVLCHFSLIVTLAGARMIVKVFGHQYQWLASGYDLEIGHF